MHRSHDSNISLIAHLTHTVYGAYGFMATCLKTKLTAPGPPVYTQVLTEDSGIRIYHSAKSDGDLDFRYSYTEQLREKYQGTVITGHMVLALGSFGRILGRPL